MSSVARSRRMLIHDPTSFPDAAALWITSVVEAVIRRRGRCALALTGGDTPRPIYERMARPRLAERVAWEHVAIFFGDERCVPPDDRSSNYRMAHDALLRHLPLRSGSIHRMEGERVDRDAAARDYARLLPDRLDLLLLGVGEDGHTASLFPHSPALAEQARRVVAVHGPASPPWRLTITPPVIRAAEAVMVLAAGAGKAAIVARAMREDRAPDELPVQLALDGTWILDGDAASGLRPVSHGGTR